MIARALSVAALVAGGFVMLAVGRTGGQPAAQPGHAPVEGAAVQTPACLKKLAWLNGAWAGVMEGEPVEETWSPPVGDSLIGMFRWQGDGKTRLYEMLVINAQDETATLKLRHFDSTFTPWKTELEGIATLTATENVENHVTFTNKTEIGGLASCDYLRTGDELAITVSFKDDKRPALHFTLKRR